jgi:tetratricopeptide (TPR) repeat protein
MASDMGDLRLEVWITIILAWITQTEGDLETTEQLRHQSLELCRQIGERPQEIHCVTDLAMTLMLSGKLEEGLPFARLAVFQSVEYGFKEKEGWARSVLGNYWLHLGEFDRSHEEIQRALALVKETGNVDVERGLWTKLGYLALISGDQAANAMAFFEEALKLSEAIQDRIFLGHGWIGLLISSCQIGDEDKARRYAMCSLEHVVQLRHRAELPQNLAALAYFLAHFGDRQQALIIWRLANKESFVNRSIWYQDVIGKAIEERTEDVVLPEPSESTDIDLWTAAESILEQLMR